MPAGLREDYIVGSGILAESMPKVKPLAIFSEEACRLLSCVSRYILKDSDAKKYPDVITFGFWCRKSNIEAMKKRYAAKGIDAGLRLGRGVTFHIAPSNVAVNFAYSLAVGLMAGNANIVRASSKPFAQTGLICNAFRAALHNECKEMARYVCIVRYGHDKGVNDMFSSLCDVRVIWGGDATIQEIRKSPLHARAYDMTFADRYSLCIIDADAYLRAQDKQGIAQGFYNDTYLSDQNACTSPKLVIWVGREKEQAKKEFWEALHAYTSKRYTLQPFQAMDKYLAVCLLGIHHENARYVKAGDNLATRVTLHSLQENTLDYGQGSGFFLEYDAGDLTEIIPVCGKKCQTVSYYGVQAVDIKGLIQSSRCHGIDRVVPIGQAMDFSIIWDGMDLIEKMSREVIMI